MGKKRVTIKQDMRRFMYIMAAIFSILVIFTIFSSLVLLPIYLWAKHFRFQYTIGALSFIGIVLFLLALRKCFKISKFYIQKIWTLLHLFVVYLQPLIVFLLFILSNVVMIRVLFQVMSTLPAFLTVCFGEVVLIALLFMNRILSRSIKDFLLGKMRPGNPVAW